MGGFLRHTWDLLLKGGLMAAGFLQGMIAGNNHAVVLLLILMVGDYITGVVAAALRKSPNSKRGGLNSDVGWHGLLKKSMILLVVLLAYVLDEFVGQHNAMFQSAVTWFYISNEGISFLENLGLCGVPVPQKLKMALEKLAEDEKADQQETAGQADEAAAS